MRLDLSRHAAQLAEQCARRPWHILTLALLVSLLSVWATAHLPIYTSRQALLPQNTPVAERLNGFLKKFGAASDLIVVLEGAPPAELEAYANTLAERLRAEPEIGQVSERLDVRFLLEHGFLMAPPERLDQFGAALDKLAGMDLPGDTRGLDAALRKGLAWLEKPPPMGDTDLHAAEQSLEALGFFLGEWQRWLTAEAPPTDLEWTRLLAQFGAGELGKGYFTSRDGRLLFLFVHAKNPSEEFEALAPFVERVKTVAADLATEAKAAGRAAPKVGLTGLPAVEYEEYLDVRKDIVFVVTTSAGLIALLILGVVRSVRWALAIFVPMGMGVVWSLGLALLGVGHLTIVTAGFIAILFGLGADYGIFTTSSIAEQRRAGKPLVEAIGLGIGASFHAVFTAGGASVLIFGALTTVDFPGFAELGRVAAEGVLMILIATWMVQPALYALLPPKLKESRGLSGAEANQADGKPGLGDPVRSLRLRSGNEADRLAASPSGSVQRRGTLPRPVAFILVIAAIGSAVAGGVKGFSIPFDYDVLALLPKDSEAAHYQRRMAAESDYQPEVVIFTAKNLAEARRITDEAGKLKTIAKVQSLTNLFPPDADQRLRKARAIGEAVTQADFAEKVIQLERGGMPEKTFGLVKTALDKSLDPIDNFQEQAFSAGHANLVKGLEQVRGSIESLRAALDQNPERGRERSELYFRTLLGTAGSGLGILNTWRKVEPLAPDQLPASLRDRFFAPDGTIAVYAFPAESVYDPANLERLTHDVYSVSPEATGFPVTHLEFSKIVVESFTRGTVLAVVACLIWLMLVLRSLRGFVLAALPLLIGGGWMLGVMALVGIKYNYANIIALPLVIALAVDYGVWFSHRWLELKDHSPFQVSVIAGKVILLAAGTELAGLGAIAMANYRGVSSLGLDITIGLLCCLPATLVVAPAIGQLIDSGRKT
ncbi:MMPL family transporter [Methylomagnum sp.]